jgi:predicted permease
MPTLPHTIDMFMADLRYAARALRSTPGFAFAAVMTLALGIGANTAVFSVVDGVLLKPLPFSQPDRLVELFQNDRRKGIDRGAVAPGNFVDWRERSASFSGLAAAEPFSMDYTGPDGQEQVYDWNVTEDFFSVLNAQPVVGRLFVPSDHVRNSPHVLVLTYAAWQGRFGGDDHIVGRQLTLNATPSTIVGVLPADFAYLPSTKMEFYAPSINDTQVVRIRNNAWWHVVGRLKPNTTPAQASADLNRIAAQLSVEYPETNADAGVTVIPLQDTIVGNVARALVLLLGAVGCVLFIACANVANLILGRTTRRSREFAIRAALGAGRGRVIRQMLTESLLVAALGAAAGIGVAAFGVRVIRVISPASIPRVDDMRVDGRTLVFVLAAIVIATLVCGVLPALRAATPTGVGDLKAGARTVGSGRQHRLRSVFVVTETALAVMLLIGAGLLGRSFLSVIRADRGYESDHLLATQVFVYQWGATPQARAQLVARLVERTAAIPGVVAAGATSSLPLDIAIGPDHGPFTIAGRGVRTGDEPTAHMTALTPGAFAALGISLRRGRLLTPSDGSASAPVAVISETMAHRYWPRQDPLGQRITFGFNGPPTEREIVGIVDDVRQVALDTAPDPTIYVPHVQSPTGAMTLLLRTSKEPHAVTRDLRRAVADVNPALPISGVETMDELVSASLKPRQFTLALFMAFAGAALVLAVIGVYGVISQGTAERKKEFAVRLALGARPRNILAMVVRHGAASSGLGIALGAAAAASLTTLVRNMLFDVEPFDAVTFGAVAAIMFGTALAACYLPARRATLVDPLESLRDN